MSREQKHLESLFVRGRISRREFLAKAAALGLITTLSPVLAGLPAYASTPKKGGRFRMGLTGGSTSDTLDNATLDEVMNSVMNWTLRNSLVELDHEFNIIPELAESWEASTGATQWVFRLLKGVEFHNGKTMEADDVIYSINHHRGENSTSGAKGLVDQIEDIRADDKYTVIFNLKTGNADFPYILNDFHLTIVPSGTAGQSWDEGIGTGGYTLESWEPGVRAFFKRNPNYFKAGRAHFDEIEIINIPDDNARTNALKTGRIDYMSRVELKTAHLMKKIPGIQVVRSVGGFHYTMPMHVDAAPFDNNDVRLAMKYAIDREQLVKMFLRGYGTVANDHPLSIQRFAATEEEIPQRHYDPDKAAFHLKKAGLTGSTFKLHASDLGGFVDLALLYKEQAAKAGINFEVIRHPQDGYWKDVWLKKPFIMCYWGGRPTADTMLSTVYSGDSSWNDTHFHHQRFDDLLKEARTELDDKKRREKYVECQRILKNEGGAVIPFFKNFVEAASTRVAYGDISGSWEADGYHAPERWWFKS